MARISVRIDDDLLDRIDGLDPEATRTDTVLDLLRRGLDSPAGMGVDPDTVRAWQRALPPEHDPGERLTHLLEQDRIDHTEADPYLAPDGTVRDDAAPEVAVLAGFIRFHTTQAIAAVRRDRDAQAVFRCQRAGELAEAIADADRPPESTGAAPSPESVD